MLVVRALVGAHNQNTADPADKHNLRAKHLRMLIIFYFK